MILSRIVNLVTRLRSSYRHGVRKTTPADIITSIWSEIWPMIWRNCCGQVKSFSTFKLSSVKSQPLCFPSQYGRIDGAVILLKRNRAEFLIKVQLLKNRTNISTDFAQWRFIVSKIVDQLIFGEK